MGPRPDFNITPAFKAAVVSAYETWSDNKVPRSGALMSKEIDEKASLLGRMLTHFQLSAGSKMPLPVVIAHVRLVHQVSGELLELLKRAPAGTTVEMNTKLGEAGAALLAEFFQDQETPDTLPPDWDHD